MATTTNFGWETPDDTDLVKDGALAMRTLGNAIDTSLVDLKGGTTGQNLRKNSNTDMDFVWAGDATNTVIDAEGDLLVGDAADTLQRLAIGTTGQVLTVDTTLDGKVKWASPSSGGLVRITGATFSAVSSLSLPNNTFSSTYRNYRIIYNIDTNASSPSGVFYRFRSSGSDHTGADYYPAAWKIPYSGSAAVQWQGTGITNAQIADSFSPMSIVMDVFSPNEVLRTMVTYDSSDGSLGYRACGNIITLSTTAFDSQTIYMTSGNMTGRYDVYGYAKS